MIYNVVHINDNFSFDSFNHNFYSQVSFMSCFSTNNPISLYNHFITISAGSQHLTSFPEQTSLSTPEKVYQSTQINEKNEQT